MNAWLVAHESWTIPVGTGLAIIVLGSAAFVIMTALLRRGQR